MAVITENEIDLSVVNLKPIQDEINNINTHLVIGEKSIDIVGDDGTVYASYGSISTFYGDNSTLTISANGLSLSKGEGEDADVYFEVTKTNPSDIANDWRLLSITAPDQTKSAELTRSFTSFTGLELVYNYGTEKRAYVDTNGETSGFFYDDDGLKLLGWSLNGNTVSLTSVGIDTKYRQRINGTYKPRGVYVFGHPVEEARITFNGVDLNGPAVKIVNIGTEHFTGTAAHSVSAEKVMDLPRVRGYTPIALSHTNAGGTSGYRLVIVESAIDTDAMTFTFKAFNTAASQAVGDLTVFVIYARN